jgi:hypothetical protein
MSIGISGKKGFLKLLLCNVPGVILRGPNGSQRLLHLPFDLFFWKGRLSKGIHQQVESLFHIFLQHPKAQGRIVSTDRRIERGAHGIEFFIEGGDGVAGRSKKKTSGRQTSQTLFSGRISSRSRIDEKVNGDKRKRVFLADQKDEAVGKDHSLNGRHGTEEAL